MPPRTNTWDNYTVALKHLIFKCNYEATPQAKGKNRWADSSKGLLQECNVSIMYDHHAGGKVIHRQAWKWISTDSVLPNNYYKTCSIKYISIWLHVEDTSPRGAVLPYLFHIFQIIFPRSLFCCHRNVVSALQFWPLHSFLLVAMLVIWDWELNLLLYLA